MTESTTTSSEPASKKQKIMSPSNGTTNTAIPPAAFEQTSLLVQKLSPKGRVPTRGSPMSAGYDLYSAEDTVVPAKGKALVATDLSIACPPGTYGRVAPRSGLDIVNAVPISMYYAYLVAVKHFIDTGAGVIDEDYRGPVKVLLFNHADVDFQISEGDRIAQLVLEKIYTPPVIEVESLTGTERGVGGFGSTGK